MADAREAYKFAVKRSTKPNLSVKKDGKDSKEKAEDKLKRLVGGMRRSK